MLSDQSWLAELYLLSHGGNGPSSRQRVIDAMLEHIVRGFGGVSGCLAVQPRGAPSGLVIAAVIDLPPSVVGRQVSVGEGVLGRVLESACPMLINGDVRADERFRDLPDAERRRPSSSVCWPLLIESRLIGVLSINRSSAQPRFEAGDLESGRGAVATMAIVVDNWQMHSDLQDRVQRLSAMNEEIQAVNRKLADVNQQLLQSEKMASIGQLSAGLAHEINNPVGYVSSNLQTLGGYVQDLLRLIDLAAKRPESKGLLDAGGVDLAFLRDDMAALLEESKHGLDRVKKIVQDLKNFSRVEQTDDWHEVDLVACLTSTLNIVGSELKHKATITDELVTLPPVQCLASQINQVFLNLLVNASQAIEKEGCITLRCGHDAAPDGEGEGQVWFEIGDNGCGIKPEHLSHIFEPFFTTKPVGKGTGLGLSLSYSIIQKHRGRLEVDSEPGIGTRFRVVLPVRQTELMPA